MLQKQSITKRKSRKSLKTLFYSNAHSHLLHKQSYQKKSHNSYNFSQLNKVIKKRKYFQISKIHQRKTHAIASASLIIVILLVPHSGQTALFPHRNGKTQRRLLPQPILQLFKCFSSRFKFRSQIKISKKLSKFILFGKRCKSIQIIFYLNRCPRDGRVNKK